MNELDRLIDRLKRDVVAYRDFHGTIYRIHKNNEEVFHLKCFGGFRHRFQSRSARYRVSEADYDRICGERKNHNAGVHEMNDIAPTIKRILEPIGVCFPEGATPGASVMAWALEDRLVDPDAFKRGDVGSRACAFSLVLEKVCVAIDRAEAQPVQQMAPDASTEAGAQAQAQAKQTKSKIKSVSEIPADRLVPYLADAQLRLKWNEAKKPSGDQLKRFLDELDSYGTISEWEKLRNTDRSRAIRFGYNADEARQWVKSLKCEIDRRKNAGILVSGADYCD